ncbi:MULTISPECIES: hypothetical protein [unclassified Herbaspirillum]|uniref:hypothetical protein n=1 Tax=unclassified Herbaspirillum TaxID=2624150 RepID=UPI000C0A2DF1|nr:MULTISPECIES: hypothetical protein [unclassified Herbaspirillum]MAF04964.1 hypothetical protein [Herbaspirillum sp.]MBO18512.1 hypothetical protein [Herbaspirillum sp.]|tara:strand:+ start:3420 stop:3926 length:507 start_codon:yes stop_codon:yes gene_type:complete
MADEQEMIVRMTRMETMMDGFREGQADIKDMLRRFLATQEIVTQHGEAIKALLDSDQRMVLRMDSHSQWQTQHEEVTERMIDKIDLKFDNKIDEVWKSQRAGFTEIATFQNRMRGGMAVAYALLGLIGSASLIGVSSLVNTVNKAEQINLVQAQEIAELRRMVTKEGR